MERENKTQDQRQHHLLPIKTYLKVFVALLFMIFVNIGISKLPIPSFWMVVGLVSVAIVQTILVAVFFMELIHEDRFYAFVFGSSILFMLLFFVITLFELRGRDFFSQDEGIKVMRQYDQGGNFAPNGPKLPKEEKK